MAVKLRRLHRWQTSSLQTSDLQRRIKAQYKRNETKSPKDLQEQFQAINSDQIVPTGNIREMNQRTDIEFLDYPRLVGADGLVA